MKRISKILFVLKLPILLFVLSQLVLMIVLIYEGQEYTLASTWIRWDAGHYIGIAEKGYEFFPCAGHFGYPEDALDMCGNTGWFPGYPWVLKVFSVFFGDLNMLAPAVSKLMLFLSILLFSQIANIKKVNLTNVLIVGVPTFWFGFIYYSSAFPISTLVFVMLLGVYFFMKKRKVPLLLACAIASVIYPTGFLFSIAISLTLLITTGRNWKKVLTALTPILFGFIGVCLVFLSMQVQVNDWSAFIQVQTKYGHGLHNPLRSIKGMLNGLTLDFSNRNNYIIIQSLSVLILYGLTTILFIRKEYYKDKLFLFAFVFFTIYLGFPWLVGGELSMYRAEAVLLPATFIYKDLSRKWLVMLNLVLLLIGGVMCHLFLIDVLY